MHASRDLGHVAGSDIRDAEPTEAALVARERDATSVGRHGVRPLPHPPRRACVLERFVDQRAVADPDVEPTGVVADGDARSVRHRSRLMHAAGTDGHRVPSRRDPSNVRCSTRAASHGMSGTFHAVHIAAVPSTAIAGSKQKSADPSSSRSAGTIAIEPAPPHLGLVDGVDGEARVARDRRSFDARVRTVSGEPSHRPAGDRVQPQIATDRRRTRCPNRRGASRSNRRRVRGRRPAAAASSACVRAHRATATTTIADEPPVVATNATRRTIGRQLRFGQLASGDAHLRRDVVLVSVRWRGHHGEDTRHMSHETHLHRPRALGHDVISTTGEEVYR